MARHPRDVNYEGYGGIGFDRDRSGREFWLSENTLFYRSGQHVPYSQILDEIHELREAATARRASFAKGTGQLAVNGGNGAANGHGTLAETTPFDTRLADHTNGVRADGNGSMNGHAIIAEQDAGRSPIETLVSADITK